MSDLPMVGNPPPLPRVTLEHNPKTGEFRVVDGDRKVVDRLLESVNRNPRRGGIWPVVLP